jgi:hypothetical protein
MLLTICESHLALYSYRDRELVILETRRVLLQR